MQVKLKVLGGKNAGKEIKIPLARFFIGRGEDCHLRPQSDLISRHHCALLIENGQVIVRDLKSRNGTFVNDEKISGDVPLKLGDRLKVGPLEFEVLIDHSLGGTKKPKVADVKEAAERISQAADSDDSIDEDITSWLQEADEEERSKRIHEPGSRQFRLDTAELLAQTQEGETAAAAPAHDTARQPKTTDTADEQKKKKAEKKEPGKLPKINPQASGSSREAAAEMLKKFFNRR